jgi:hypothetical protein
MRQAQAFQHFVNVSEWLIDDLLHEVLPSKGLELQFGITHQPGSIGLRLPVSGPKRGEYTPWNMVCGGVQR